ncbi:MAG: adenylate kinase family protein [Roseiflexaceae bacterium]
MVLPHTVQLILMGPPGAGKSTVAHALAEYISVNIISTGVLLRAEIATGSALGHEIAAAIDHGNYVTDTLINQVLTQHLAHLPTDKGLILDGYPRTLSQAYYLPELLATCGRTLTRVIELDVPDVELIRRLSGRRMCVSDHGTFPVHIDDPAALAECAAHGGSLQIRPDDEADVVRHRIDVYNRATEPLIAFYRQQGMLLQIDGNAPAPVIARHVLEQLS